MKSAMYKIYVRYWIPIVILLTSCVFNQQENGKTTPCEGGHYSYSLYYAYNSFDSLKRSTYVNGAGDTLDFGIYEYHEDKSLSKIYWVKKSGDGILDTSSCVSYKLSEERNKIVSTYCNNPEKIFSVSELNEYGAITRTEYYDSIAEAEYYALTNIYDTNGYLIKVEYEDSGAKYIRKTFLNNEEGHWLSSNEYTREGRLLQRRYYKKTSQNEERIQVKDSLGSLQGWMIISLNERGQAARLDGCSP